MENKIREHIQQIFANLPEGIASTETLAEQEAKTLRQAMDRYHDLIVEGKKPEIACETVLNQVGEAADIIEEMHRAEEQHSRMNEQKFTPEQLRRAAKRSGILQAIATFLYITCATPPILLSTTGLISSLAPALLLAMVAVATALLVYNANTRLPRPTTAEMNDEEQETARRKSTRLKSLGVLLIILAVIPLLFTNNNQALTIAMTLCGIGLGVGCLVYDKNTRPQDFNREQAYESYKKWEENQSRERTVLRIANCIIWLAAVAFYLFISVKTQAWHATWLIFPLAWLIASTIKAVLQKHSKSAVILRAIAAAVVILILAASLAAAMLGFRIGGEGGFGLDMSNVSYDNTNLYQVGNAQIADNIHSLEINWTAGNIHVQAYDGSTVSLSESTVGNEDSKLRYYVDNGNLIIQYCRSNIGFGKNIAKSKDLTVKIPRAMADNLRNLEISSTSAAVTLENITVGELDADNVSGNLICRNVTTRETGVDTVSGDCEYHGHCDNLDFNSTSGSLTYTAAGKICPQEVDASTISGDVQLVLPADCPGFVAILSSLSTDFETDFFVSADSEGYRCGNGGAEYECDTVSGRFSIMQRK